MDKQKAGYVEDEPLSEQRERFRKKQELDEERSNAELLRLVDKIKALKAEAAHGQKFKDGPRNRRADKLSKEMEKAYKRLSHNRAKPTAKEVLSALPVGPSEIVQDIDEDDVIEWTGKGGIKKYTSFKKFQRRLTLIKQKNLS
ncbi:hypothetical protein NBG4_640003 [Candidatus Sulfobium mesophilum]|uniref:Uncharacterized protein n=1 Tax=Candidatus Sulfobium mesophilum TaxID=2016548 RepID=A0A2U3QJT8_9BACT|nr:hypothetical protein NBG4_640003 [Candidatus Sulfobium mesophilum]